MASVGPTMVIISYWVEREAKSLFSLIEHLFGCEAGAPFSLTVVCNGGDERPMGLPRRFAERGVNVLNRENRGFNIGAWDFGWRAEKGHEHFLFLQDDCYVVREGWLGGFLEAMNRGSNIGLLGESFRRPWSRPWEELKGPEHNVFAKGHETGGRRMRRVDLYLDFLWRRGIPPGESARHLQALALFASREVLTEIGGFPTGGSYGESIGAEIAISKKVEAHGYSTALAGLRPFYYFGHREWTEKGSLRPRGRRGGREEDVRRRVLPQPAKYP